MKHIYVSSTGSVGVTLLIGGDELDIVINIHFIAMLMICRREHLLSFLQASPLFILNCGVPNAVEIRCSNLRNYSLQPLSRDG